MTDPVQRRARCPACAATTRTRLEAPPHCPECGEAMSWSERGPGRPRLTPAELLRRQAGELLELADEIENEREIFRRAK